MCEKMMVRGLLAVAFVAASMLAGTAMANIYVSNSLSGTIGEYTNSGEVVNASLISGLTNPHGIAVSGSYLFVANAGSGIIGEYTTSGEVVNASLITGLTDPIGLAVSGSNLFVSNYVYSGGPTGTIGEYTTSGAVVNASLVTGLSGASGIAVSGSNLFVANYNGGTVGEYTTSGAVVNASFVSTSYPSGIAVSGSDLYVLANQYVTKYDSTGALEAPAFFVGNCEDIALYGSDLYVTNLNRNSVDEFTTSGAVLNSPLIVGLNDPSGIAVTKGVPEPSSLLLLGIAAASLLACVWRRR